MARIRRNSLTLDKLRFIKGRLYGREVEEKTLQDAYRKVVNSTKSDENTFTREMVMVTGQSGAGKSALVENLSTRVKKRGDYYISGKFDLLERSMPYSALIDALGDLPKQMEGDIGGELQQKIGRDVCGVIVNLVPALKEVMFPGEEDVDLPKTEHHNMGSVESRNQFSFALRTFIRKLCEEDGKNMVLFVDDLQWADASSLELIEILATDKKNHSLLIIGSYRHDEVSETHPLSARLREIKQSDVLVRQLRIGELPLEVVNTFVSDTINMQEAEVEPLSALVHAKTKGNVFFVIQFLNALAEGELLTFNIGMTKWQWDIDAINQMHVTSNVADLLLAKLRKIPSDQSQLLALSSCLGSCFDLTILIIVVDYLKEIMASDNTACPVKEALSFLTLTSANIQACIDQELAEGLLEQASRRSDHSFRFSHDQVQQASFASIPVESREILQWCIGQAFVSKLPPSQLDKVLFGAIDLLNSGQQKFLSSLGNNSFELHQLAKLNLSAGIKARTVSAFQQSVTYLETCIKCLHDLSGEVDLAWIQHPDICLKAYQACADSLRCVGDYAKMDERINTIFRYTTSKEGRMAAYYSLVESLSSRNEYKRAFKEAFAALRSFGQVFPVDNPSKFTVVKELLLTKAFMKKYPVEKINELPLMNDPPRAILMKILISLAPHVYLECRNYLPLIVFRLVRWSCEYGLSGSSSPAFALYGLLVAGAAGDLKGGHAYTTLAMDLIQHKVQDKSEYSFTNLVATMIKGNLHPVINCKKEYLFGYQVGMENGDNYYAVLNLAQMLLTSLCVGQPLPLVSSDMKLYIPTFSECGQVASFKRALPIWQFVDILMGAESDWDGENSASVETSNCELSGSLMNETAYLKQFEEDEGQVCVTLVFKQFLAFYFGNYKLAGKLSDKTQDYDTKHRSGDFLGVRYVFFDCLTALAMLSLQKKQKLSSRKWRKRKARGMKKMATWQRKGNVNINHMLLLLEAEAYGLKRKSDVEVARGKFDAAISAAARAGFANDNALANERAGVFCAVNNDEFWASSYMTRAHQRWAEYGALTICKRLEMSYPRYITEEVKASSMRIHRGAKERYTRRSMNRKSIVFKDKTESWASMRSSTLTETPTTQPSSASDTDRPQLHRNISGLSPGPSVRKLNSSGQGAGSGHKSNSPGQESGSGSVPVWTKLNMTQNEYMEILNEDDE